VLVTMDNLYIIFFVEVFIIKEERERERNILGMTELS